MISEGIRFDRISVLTLCIRTDSVDPDQMPLNTFKPSLKLIYLTEDL